MAIITPTITTADPHEYRDQMTLISGYAEGVHLDFSDGIFTPEALLPLEEAWRSDDVITHAHIMHQDPAKVIDEIMQLEPDLVILHIESDHVKQCLHTLRENGTRTGIALLADSELSDIKELDIDGLFDHVLVFGGHLGFQGGKADLSLLDKVNEIRDAYSDIEIAWDGGVNAQNAKEIAAAGVDVLNVGGYLKNNKNPQKAYADLTKLVS